jgi:hypothetical protein
LAPDCIHRSTAKKRLLTSASSSSSFLLSFLIETNTIVYQHKLGTNVRKKTQKGGRPHTSQVCIHTIALNVENSFQPVDLQLALPGANSKTCSFWSCQFRPFFLVKTVVCQDRLGTNIREDPQRRGQFSFSGLPENTTAFLPFEDMQDRLVPVVNGVLKDMIAPHGVNVYRIGCDVPCTGTAGMWGSGCTALQKKNLSPNPGKKK